MQAPDEIRAPTSRLHPPLRPRHSDMPRLDDRARKRPKGPTMQEHQRHGATSATGPSSSTALPLAALAGDHRLSGMGGLTRTGENQDPEGPLVSLPSRLGAPSAQAGMIGDRQLLAAVAVGDRGALRRLYELHAPWLTGRLARRVSSRELAEEALQDTFMVAWRRAGAYTDGGEIRAWLWGIARRCAANLARRERRVVPVEAAEERPADEPGPEELALSADAAARLRAAVARLPLEERAGLTPVAYEGRTIEEVALAAGVPTGTVKSRLHRARLRMRGEL